jgi:hypothetical protein
VAAGGYGNESVAHDRPRALSIAEGEDGGLARWYIWRPGGARRYFAIRLDPIGRGEDRFLRWCSPRSCVLQYGLSECEQEDWTADHLGQERVTITIPLLLFVTATFDRQRCVRLCAVAPVLQHSRSHFLNQAPLPAQLRNPVGWSPRTRRPTARTASHGEQATGIKSGGH